MRAVESHPVTQPTASTSSNRRAAGDVADPDSSTRSSATSSRTRSDTATDRNDHRRTRPRGAEVSVEDQVAASRRKPSSGCSAKFWRGATRAYGSGCSSRTASSRRTAARSPRAGALVRRARPLLPADRTRRLPRPDVNPRQIGGGSLTAVRVRRETLLTPDALARAESAALEGSLLPASSTSCTRAYRHAGDRSPIAWPTVHRQPARRSA